MYLDFSPLFSPVYQYSYVYIGRETVINHAAYNVESRPLNCWKSVSTALLVELTVDMFEIIDLYQRSGSLGTVRTRPMLRQTRSGSGIKMREFLAEGCSPLQASMAETRSELRVLNTEEPSPRSSCNFGHDVTNTTGGD